MGFLESRIELHRWLSQVVIDAQDRKKLDMELPEVTLCFAEKLTELLVYENAQRVRKSD